jgi:hypothetical protein
MTTPATMQWGCPQPQSGEGDEAMRRSGVMTTPATMQWGCPSREATMQSEAMRRSGVNAQATHRPDPVATTAVTAVTRT